MAISLLTAKDWCRWAKAEYLEGRRDRALIGFRRAIAAEPGSLPPRFALAAHYLDMGDLAAAMQLSDEICGIAPDRPETVWLQARIAAARGDPRAAHNTLVRILADSRISDAQRAEAELLHGLVLEDLGDSAAAFTSAARGKHMQRVLFAAEASSREHEVAKLQRLTRWLRTASIGKSRMMPPAANAAASHVFLIGFPRSGTTLLEQVLAASPDVEALEEEATLATAYQAFLSDASACETLCRLEDDEAAAWVEHYWSKVRDHGLDVTGKLFVDKQPAGTLYLPLIARLFPEAKILFALRDPRDVVLSCFRQAFRMNAMTYAFTDLAETAACYDACMAFGEVARARLPLAWMNVRHERLVEQFENELASIATFLGLAPDTAMHDFVGAAHARPIRTPSATQVRAGLNRRGLGRWRQFERELAPVLPLLAPWVERFGYTL